MSAAAKRGRREQPDEASDRLAGFAAPREVPELFGHEAAKAEFAAARVSGRLHHGWLLSGPEGIGKATLAYALARELLAENVGATAPHDPDSPLFVQVAGRAHPNLLIVNRSITASTGRVSQWIGVDGVRRLRSFLGGTASQKGWRVVIVDRADEMNLNAANALLKALEEPPERTVFLLVAAAEGRLPVTIRSRCRSLRLHPLPQPALESAVQAALAREAYEVEPDALATALALANGSVRAALSLATGETIGLYRGLLDGFRRLPDVDEGWLHGLADKLSAPANADSFAAFFGLLLALIERLVKIAATGEGGNDEERKIASRLLNDDNLGAWADAWEGFGKAYGETMSLNLDKGLLLLETFSRLQQLAASRPV